jgi:DUF4097 and DUF4098 domain-containing protein YvlB
MNNWKLIALLMVGTTALADEPVNRTLDAETDGTVTVENVAGSVEVRGWSRNQVEVTGTLGDRVEELVFERDGDEIIIEVKVPRRHSGGIASDLSINVPERSTIEVDTVSADIEVADVLGEQELESVSGDITTEAHAANIELGTVSGDIEVQGDNQPIRSELTTVSGDIDADSLSGEIGIEAVNGDVSAINGSFSRARVETVNGDIVFHAGLVGDGRLDVETINGTVDIDFGGDVSARFDIETFNGDIRNCFGPEPVRTSKYAPGRELRFTEGDGDARVSIQTLNGNLRLCK